MSDDIDVLRGELSGLFKYMQRVRKEIATIHHPVDEEHQITKMSDQLDAIVAATEDATDTIMEMSESIQNSVQKIRDGEDLDTALNQIDDNCMAVFQACSFQDITGQRVSKVLKSIRFVEERINNLVEVWGVQEIEQEEVDGLEKTEDEALLNGPQLETSKERFNQDDIDALFD